MNPSGLCAFIGRRLQTDRVYRFKKKIHVALMQLIVLKREILPLLAGAAGYVWDTLVWRFCGGPETKGISIHVVCRSRGIYYLDYIPISIEIWY